MLVPTSQITDFFNIKTSLMKVFGEVNLLKPRGNFTYHQV
jgi:hypothetical protein